MIISVRSSKASKQIPKNYQKILLLMLINFQLRIKLMLIIILIINWWNKLVSFSYTRREI